jgi:type I restriction enzyme S subunit
MSEWKEYRLGDIADYINRGVTPSYSDEGVIVINQKCVRDGQVKYEQSGYTNSEKKKISEEKYLKSFDILINSTGQGTLGRVGQVKKIISPTTVDSHLTIVRINKNNDPIFLGYVLKSKQSIIEDLAEGTTGQTELSRYKVAELPLVLPDLPTQTAIAEILSSLDDKIELNNKINQDLENLAQTLFKQWFIDFEFLNENGEPYKSSCGEMVDSELGEIPKGWEVKRLETHAKISLGGTPSRNNGDYWNGNIPWVNSGAINENYILKPIELITQEGLDNSSTKLIPKHSTLIAITGATLGQVSYSLIDACYNQSVISLTPPDNTKEFIHLLVNTIIPELIKHQTGGAQQHINKGNVETFKVLFPPVNILNRFKEILTDLYLKIECYIKENQQLTTLRDTLLPKLISGELEVSQIQTTS